MMLSPWS